MRELSGKVAVVTGAAGGIGSCLALECARAGMDVVLADIDLPGLKDVHAAVERCGQRALSLHTDVSKLDDVHALLAGTLAEFGSCHLLINNAGVFHGNSVLDTSDEQWERIIGVNLWGAVHGSRVFGRHFVGQSAGHIVNIASAAGLLGVPGMNAYSPSKFGVVGLSQVLRWELGPQGVGVTVVCPGIVRTEMSSAAGVGLEHVADQIGPLLQRCPPPGPLAIKVMAAVRGNRGKVLYGADSQFQDIVRHLPEWLVDRFGHWSARRVLAVLRGEKRID